MVAIKKTNQILYDTNLVANQTHIYIARKRYADSVGIEWEYKYGIYWEKYSIKETDFRSKTASFTSPNYIDLTTGVYCVLITSPAHEDFGGEILNVEYDEKTGLYTYQCQDFSRDYQSKMDIVVANVKTYRLLKSLMTRGQIGLTGKIPKSQQKKYKKLLTGLKPAYQYQQGKENGSRLSFNPMNDMNNIIIRNKSYIETIKDIVYGSGAFIDVYIDKYGHIQIQPYHHDDLFNSGLYITTPEIASRNCKFDITNIITGTIVSSTDSLKGGKFYSAETLTNLDLSVFFGKLNNVISNPNQAKSTGGKSSSKKKSKTSTSKDGKGTPVYINTDNIHGKSQDKQMLKDIAKHLKKRGYKVTVGGIGSMTHYNDINKVKKNGIYFTMYGGRCAGTLKEQCESNHYWNVLNKKKAKMVVGFLNKHLSDKFLKRAYDDNFSPSGFTGWDKPRTKLLNKGIGIAEGKNAKEIAGSFPGFKK